MGTAWEEHAVSALTSTVITCPPPPLTTGTCPATGVQLAAQLGKQFARAECATLGVCLSLLANLLCSNRALLIYNHGNNAKRCACLCFGLWKPEHSLFLSLGFGEAGWVWRHGAGPGGHICSCVTSNAELPFWGLSVPAGEVWAWGSLASEDSSGNTLP